MSELSVHMRKYADTPLFPDRAEGAFAKELEELRARADKVMKAARAWNYAAAAAEVINWINARALTGGTVFPAFSELERRGSARYDHEVPPGFEDAHKRKNKYGDLIFWEDVLGDARRRGAHVVAVLTRDRKKDWYFSNSEPSVGRDLKRLRGKWDPVPVPHPLLSLEVRSNALAEFLLIDELYLGAVLWSIDRKRFGRIAAVAFGMDPIRLAEETAPPPDVPSRAARRAASDTTSLRVARDIVTAAMAAPGAAVAEMLEAIGGEAPSVEAAIDALSPERIQALEVGVLSALSRRLYEGALSGPSADLSLASLVPEHDDVTYLC